MIKKYIIQDLITKKYWYGYYSNKEWTDNILEVRSFDKKSEAKEFIKSLEVGFVTSSNMLLTIIEVWY